MNKILLALLLSVSSISTYTYIDNTKKVKENEKIIQEKEAIIKSIETKNSVLMSKQDIDRRYIAPNATKDLLNKETTLYPIKYNKNTYFFWVDSITKQSVDMKTDYRYEVTVKYQILKDKGSEKNSYLLNDFPKLLNNKISKKNNSMQQSSKSKGDNETLKVPSIDYAGINEVDVLQRELLKDMVIYTGSTKLSFGVNGNTLKQDEVISLFIKHIVLKDKKPAKFSIKEDTNKLIIKVDNNYFEYFKETHKLNEIQRR